MAAGICEKNKALSLPPASCRQVTQFVAQLKATGDLARLDNYTIAAHLKFWQVSGRHKGLQNYDS
ncbi:MAG TPA: hypothetical protein VIS54_06130, partial [Psychromonas sp.]